jgi:hypothetical protein
LKVTVEIGRLPTNCDIELMINSEKPHNVWTAYFKSLEARRTQQLWAITGLSVDGLDNSLWEEVKVPPGVENFEKARDNLQTNQESQAWSSLLNETYSFDLLTVAL